MLKVSEFVKSVPQRAKALLPKALRGFRTSNLPWLSQAYYEDKRLHYELVKLPPRFGENRIEMGIHFESREKAINAALLSGFDRYLFEIRATLGDNWHAEVWDKGWTKVYTTLDYTHLDEAFADKTTRAYAQMVEVLQPIFERVYPHSLAK